MTAALVAALSVMALDCTSSNNSSEPPSPLGGSGGSSGGNGGASGSGATSGAPVAGAANGFAGQAAVAGSAPMDAGLGGSSGNGGGATGGAAAGAAASCGDMTMMEPSSKSLAGMWDFTPDGGQATKIQVPGGGWLKQGIQAPSATYSTNVSVPDSGAPQTTLIEFGAVNFESTLSIDGKKVATNLTSFTPSVFDVTTFVTPGAEHTLSVFVKGRGALQVTQNNKQIDLVPYAAPWSPNVTQGIFRSAMLRVLPDVYVSDAFVRTSVTNDTFTYDVTVTNTGQSDQQVSIAGTLSSWNCQPLTYPTIASIAVTVPAGASKAVTVGPMSWGLGSKSYGGRTYRIRRDTRRSFTI
ncbi:MAG TPA: hypothetical protein VHW01_07425 [Polyangiaceae bacterium]|nr:hypothetical protein [Polyangiaceae bacterium]